MKDMPANQLDPRVKNAWRINDAIWITVIGLCAALLVVPLLRVSAGVEQGRSA